MYKNHECPCSGGPCSTILPRAVDVCVDHSVCKVRADVTVDRIRSVMICGYVTDCSGEPVSDALVKLLKYSEHTGDFQEILRSDTDCRGRYQFDLENSCQGNYRVLVSQAVCVDACDPPCPEPAHPNGCHGYGSSSGGCRSVSRNNVQYY